MFAGLLKILQLSLPGGSAGMLVMASAHLAWGMQPGVFLGIVSACVGLGLVSAWAETVSLCLCTACMWRT